VCTERYPLPGAITRRLRLYSVNLNTTIGVVNIRQSIKIRILIRPLTRLIQICCNNAKEQADTCRTNSKKSTEIPSHTGTEETSPTRKVSKKKRIFHVRLDGQIASKMNWIPVPAVRWKAPIITRINLMRYRYRYFSISYLSIAHRIVPYVTKFVTWI
jgi:hypothetical protein